MCLVREKIDAKEYIGEKLQKSIFERFLFVLRDELSLSKPLVNWINKYGKYLRGYSSDIFEHLDSGMDSL